MKGHIHLSAVSVISVVSIIILTNFMLHQASLTLGASSDEKKQLWGKALAAGFGF